MLELEFEFGDGGLAFQVRKLEFGISNCSGEEEALKLEFVERRGGVGSSSVL